MSRVGTKPFDQLEPVAGPILARVSSGLATDQDSAKLKEILKAMAFILEEETSGFTEFDSPEARIIWQQITTE